MTWSHWIGIHSLDCVSQMVLFLLGKYRSLHRYSKQVIMQQSTTMVYTVINFGLISYSIYFHTPPSVQKLSVRKFLIPKVYARHKIFTRLYPSKPSCASYVRLLFTLLTSPLLRCRTLFNECDVYARVIRYKNLAYWKIFALKKIRTVRSVQK